MVNEAFLNDPVGVEQNANEGVKSDDLVGGVDLLDKHDGVGNCDGDEEKNNKPKYAVLKDDTYGNQESKYTLLFMKYCGQVYTKDLVNPNFNYNHFALK